MTALTHDQARQLLEMDRAQLSGAEWSALKQHLAECASCRLYAAELTALQGAVEHALQKHWQGVRPDPHLEQQIQQRVRNQTMPKRFLNDAVGLAALAVFTIVALALFAAQTQPTANSPLGTPTAATPRTATPFLTPAGLPSPASTPLSGRDFYQFERLTTMSEGATWPAESGASHPAVSPDGRRVAYSGTRVGDNYSEIYVLDLASRAVTQLTDDPSNRHLAPTWSPDGTRLAYERYPVDLMFPDVVDHIVMNADGSNPQVLFSGARRAGYASPAWSPSGDRIAFFDNTDLVIVNVNDRREIGRLGPVEEPYMSQPVWVDENRILFISQRVAKLGNVAAGTIESVAGPTSAVDQVLALGTDLMYVQQDGSTARVIRQDLGNTHSTTVAVLQTGDLRAEDVTWSPDGRFVTVQSMENLYVATEHVPAAWQHAPLFNLGFDLKLAMPTTLSWLPDSSGFVVEYAYNTERDLYLVRLNQEAIQLVENDASAAQVPPRVDIPTATPTPTWTPEPHMKFNGLFTLIEPHDGAHLPAIAPDGRRIIYTSVRAGNGDIYQTDFATLAEKRLTDDPLTETAAAWSPDGSRIAYQRYASTADGAEAIAWVVMNADGSNSQVVASGTQRLDNERPAWSPSGERLAVTDGAAIVVVSVNDRQELRRFSLAEKPLYTHPVWFDNDRLLFIDRGVLQLGNLTTGTVEPVVGPSGSVAQVLAWDSSLVYIQQTDTGARVIRQNLDGTQAVTLATLTGLTQANPIDNATLSPDGRYLAVQLAWGSSVAYVGADRPFPSNAAMDTPAVDMLEEVWGIVWLPDSSGFVCASPSELPNNAHFLYLVQPKPGSEDKPFSPLILPTATPTPQPTPARELGAYQVNRLSLMGFDGYRPVVSPDGQRVAYAAERDGQAGIFALDLVTQVETRLTTDPFRDLEVSWSPDGTRLAYEHVVQSPDGSTSTLERIVINADGSSKQVVSSGASWSAGSEAPAWSPDGTRLAFTDNTQLVVVNVADGRELGRFGPADVLIHSQPAWLDNERVLFVGYKAVKVANLTTNVVEKMAFTLNVVQAAVIRSDIAYIQQDGSTARVIRVHADGTEPATWGVIPSAMLGSVTSSPDGRFITVETSQGLYVLTESASVTAQPEPIFTLKADEAPQYLRGASWLPDSSGFIFVAAPDGQPVLYSAQQAVVNN